MAPIWSSFVESGRISAVLYVVDSSSPETIGKKHALKKYDQFARNTSCFWGSVGSNITPVVHFHDIFVAKI